MSRRAYFLHRWISGLAALQLTIWAASGLFFALSPERWVHGERVEGAHERALAVDGELVSPASVLRIAALHGFDAPTHVELRGTPAGPIYLVRQGPRSLRLDASSGELRPVTAEEAAQIVARDQRGAPLPRSVTRIERDAPIGYRDHPLPAWEVRLDDPGSTAIYVDAQTGDVSARRTRTWRYYDFLWSLHIMDYRAREDFRHPLLIAFALLALLTGATGSVLWILRIKRAQRRRGTSTPALSSQGE